MFAFLRKRPLVSICIPAYRGQGFVGDTIHSALAQTVPDTEIIVSNDGGHPTPDLDRFRSHPKVRLPRPRARLGWVDNSTFVLSKARGTYFMILPHDDLLRPRYVEECLALLERNPEVFAAYSDIETHAGVMPASEVTGSREARIREVMLNRYNGFSYRALMPRRRADWPGLRLKPNRPTDFCADATWVLQQACLGELRRVPKPLYWKALGGRNTHARWATLTAPELRQAWSAHCRQMGEIASTWINDADQVADMVSHRLDARRVAETPAYLKAAMG